jgi:hypothetical protein
VSWEVGESGVFVGVCIIILSYYIIASGGGKSSLFEGGGSLRQDVERHGS